MAVTLKAAELAGAVKGRAVDASAANQLLEAATARVLRYAPEAPDEIHNEAVIRFAGYLAQADYGAIVEDQVGPMRYQFKVNHADAFRASGAAMLLTPWRERRAGAV